MPVKTLTPPVQDTIAKNGKRVPASARGKPGKGAAAKPNADAAPPAAPGSPTAAPAARDGTVTGVKPKAPTAAPNPPTPPSRPAKFAPFKIKQGFPQFSSATSFTLAEIRVRRQNAANEEHNMVDYIKDLDGWFERHGDPGDEAPDGADEAQLAEHREKLEVFRGKSTEYQRAERDRDAARSLQRWLAKRYDAIIDMEINPALHKGAAEDAIEEMMREAPELPLFKIPKGGASVQNEDGSVDRVYEYTKKPITHLGSLRLDDGERLVSDEAIDAMREYGWKKISDMTGALDNVPGLTKSDIRSIETALDKLVEQEDAAAAAISAFAGG